MKTPRWTLKNNYRKWHTLKDWAYLLFWNNFSTRKNHRVIVRRIRRKSNKQLFDNSIYTGPTTIRRDRGHGVIVYNQRVHTYCCITYKRNLNLKQAHNGYIYSSLWVGECVYDMIILHFTCITGKNYNNNKNTQ
jgi:hypothetical protein